MHVLGETDPTTRVGNFFAQKFGNTDAVCGALCVGLGQRQVLLVLHKTFSVFQNAPFIT